MREDLIVLQALALGFVSNSLVVGRARLHKDLMLKHRKWEEHQMGLNHHFSEVTSAALL